MLGITIAAVGSLKERYLRDAADEYAKRLKPYAKLEVVEVPDRDIAAGLEKAKAEEARSLMRVVDESSYVVALDPKGQERTSEGLAAWLSDGMNEGRSRIVFVLGGAGGLHPSIRERAEESLSLSKMTLPHQLCRVVLLEQLYRAFKIIRNEPYHL